MRRRIQVAGGFLVVAALVGIGIYPVRKGITVRYRADQARRKRRPKRRGRRQIARRLLFWW